MLRLGIVGLPNVGKSTLFNALTQSGALVANYPFATIEPNTGVVTVPDARLDRLAAIVNPQRTVPASVEFVDIAGLVKRGADPARDRDIIAIELGLADLSSVEKRLDKAQKSAKSGDAQAKLEARL